jgi:type IV secretory pathway VirB2 component (pilin)
LKEKITAKTREVIMNSDVAKLIAYVLVIIFCIGVIFGMRGCNAYVQQKVWEREGVNISFFEVFCGANPVARQLLTQPQEK